MKRITVVTIKSKKVVRRNTVRSVFCCGKLINIYFGKLYRCSCRVIYR